MEEVRNPGAATGQPTPGRGSSADLRRQFAVTANDFLRARRAYFRSHSDEAAPFVQRWLLTVGEHSPVLDVGCGGGDDLLHYAALGFDNLFGIDPVDAMLRESRALLAGRAKVRRGTWQDMKCPARFYSAVIGRYSLHYLDNLDPAYREASRTLKPGGLLVFVASNPTFDAVSKRRVVIDGRACIRATVYNRTFDITYFCHSLSSYFSKAFLDNFDVLEIFEFATAIDDKEDVPSGLAVAAKKR